MHDVQGNDRTTGAIAAQLLQRRRVRDAVFQGYGDGFGEPAWDALLALYCAEAEGRGALSIAAIVEEAHAGELKAELYVEWLRSQDLVRQDSDDVALTDRGRTLMVRYLERISSSDRGITG